jgi:general secretion pathway protein N
VLDHWRPLTGVLAAVCLWAVMLLVLAWTGLGGRIDLLPDDPTGMPPVPTVKLTQVTPRLGTAGEYVEVGTRPLLMADRKPAPVTPVAGEQTAELDVALTSVLITPRLQLAILTDNQGGASHRVRVGEAVQGTSWRLVQLEPRSAVLEGPGGQRTLQLRTYNGMGGAAPTQVATGDPVPPPPSPEVPPNAMPVEAVQPPTPAPVAVTPTPENLTQEQQIEAIRRRIEARRAQMRAEAAKAQGDKR